MEYLPLKLIHAYIINFAREPTWNFERFGDTEDPDCGD
jgi:hypothetical protein